MKGRGVNERMSVRMYECVHACFTHRMTDLGFKSTMDVVSLSELTGDAREHLRMTNSFISNHYARFLFIIITVFTDSYTNEGYKTVYFMFMVPCIIIYSMK